MDEPCRARVSSNSVSCAAVQYVLDHSFGVLGRPTISAAIKAHVPTGKTRLNGLVAVCAAMALDRIDAVSPPDTAFHTLDATRLGTIVDDAVCEYMRGRATAALRACVLLCDPLAFGVDDIPAHVLATSRSAHCEARGAYERQNNFWSDVDFASVVPSSAYELEWPRRPELLEALALRTSPEPRTAPHGDRPSVLVVNTTPCRWTLSALKYARARWPDLCVVLAFSNREILQARRGEASCPRALRGDRHPAFRCKSGDEDHADGLDAMLGYLEREGVRTYLLPDEPIVEVELVGECIVTSGAPRDRTTREEWIALLVVFACVFFPM